MNNLYDQSVLNTNNLFNGTYLDAQALYLHTFNVLPDIVFVGQVGGEKAFGAVKQNFAGRIVRVFRHRRWLWEKKEYQFSSSLILFDNGCLLEFSDNWCDILHDGSDEAFVTSIVEQLSAFMEEPKKEPQEINLVIADGGSLVLKRMEINNTDLDLDLFYNEDFRETDMLIQKRLGQDNDKGIVLLHGLPGTGKTTYLRYLIGNLKKRILFLSPSAARNLMDPDFLDLLIRNPNTVLIIEDAENIIMDRKINSGSSVSNLLNISDGMLADCLNVQLVCTFNSPLTTVDSALLRKGRLIARYEFGKLSVSKAQRLSNHLGFTSGIIRPMTVAEVANQNEKEFGTPEVRTIGFRN
jgi:hypothetical protein